MDSNERCTSTLPIQVVLDDDDIRITPTKSWKGATQSALTV